MEKHQIYMIKHWLPNETEKRKKVSDKSVKRFYYSLFRDSFATRSSKKVSKKVLIRVCNKYLKSLWWVSEKSVIQGLHVVLCRTKYDLTLKSTFRTESFYSIIRRLITPGIRSIKKQVLERVYSYIQLRRNTHKCQNSLSFSTRENGKKSSKIDNSLIAITAKNLVKLLALMVVMLWFKSFRPCHMHLSIEIYHGIW